MHCLVNNQENEEMRSHRKKIRLGKQNANCISVEDESGKKRRKKEIGAMPIRFCFPYVLFQSLL